MTLLELAKKVTGESDKFVEVVYGIYNSNHSVLETDIIWANYNERLSKTPNMFKYYPLIKTTTDKFQKFIENKVDGKLSKLEVLQFKDDNGMIKILVDNNDLDDLARCYLVESMYGENYEKDEYEYF